MLQMIYHIESIALGLNPIILVISGIIFVAAGLSIWLGGLAFGKISMAIIGAIAGLACGFIIKEQITLWLVLSAFGGCVIILLFEQILSVILKYGSFLWNLILALFCSSCGTALISTGMVMLLLDKGAEPVKHITEKQSLYAAVFAAMLVFGTIEQLMFFTRQTKKKKNVTIKKENQHSSAQNWRTS